VSISQNIQINRRVRKLNNIKEYPVRCVQFFNQSKFYFNEKRILDKSIVMPISWRGNIDIGRKATTKNINFLLIASDYYAKGVDMVIDDLSDAFVKYAKNTKLLIQQTENVIEKYYKDHIVENRNKFFFGGM
jgi:hypothetical protein